MMRDPDFDRVPIVALTAKAMKGDLEKTVEAGCDDYLSKPVSRVDLLARIDAWLARPWESWFPARQAKREQRAA
jgi:CheY-like chemotaxis protein